MIRCPYKLLLCRHLGTCTCILYIVITEASIWLFQCITPWLKNCVAKKNQTATDMRSMSALLKTTALDSIRFNNINNSYDENTFCNLDWSLFYRKYRERQNPSSIRRTHFSAFQHFSTQRLAVERHIIWQRSILPLLITTSLQNLTAKP